jgi:hypothetical protein
MVQGAYDSNLGAAMKLTSDSSIRNGYALTLLRIGVGIFFLIFGQYKVFGIC